VSELCELVCDTRSAAVGGSGGAHAAPAALSAIAYGVGAAPFVPGQLQFAVVRDCDVLRVHCEIARVRVQQQQQAAAAAAAAASGGAYGTPYGWETSPELAWSQASIYICC
jgi:hypothetical protein